MGLIMSIVELVEAVGFFPASTMFSVDDDTTAPPFYVGLRRFVAKTVMNYVYAQFHTDPVNFGRFLNVVIPSIWDLAADSGGFKRFKVTACKGVRVSFLEELQKNIINPPSGVIKNGDSSSFLPRVLLKGLNLLLNNWCDTLKLR